MTSEVEPGYLRPLLPEDAPEAGEDWQRIQDDIERVIMPGITHWQHPRFHAYFPAGNSFPSILGEIFSAGLGIVGFSWASSPACTELEPIMLDWLGQSIDEELRLLNFLVVRSNDVAAGRFHHPGAEERRLSRGFRRRRSFGIRQRMHSGGDVSRPKHQNSEPTLGKSVVGRRRNSFSISLLHVEIGKTC